MSGEQGRAMPLSAARAAGLRPEPATQSQQSSIPIAGHTPLPWRYVWRGKAETNYTDGEVLAGPVDAPLGIATVRGSNFGEWLDTPDDGEAEFEANAAFIVCAVNSHYELLEALAMSTAELEAARKRLAEAGVTNWDGRLGSQCDFNRDVLARARGETA